MFRSAEAFDDVPAPSDFEVAQGIVTAASRGIEAGLWGARTAHFGRTLFETSYQVRPGRRALLPLLDLVGPPEARRDRNHWLLLVIWINLAASGHRAGGHSGRVQLRATD